MAESDWIDISVQIHDGLKGGPNDPAVEMKLVRDPDKGDPVTMSQITMITHTGSHIDSPRHFFTDGKGIDELSLDIFMGPARVIEIKDSKCITPAELEPYDIQPGERILFKTENSSRVFGAIQYDTPAVYVSKEAANFLVEKKVRLVGIDFITVGGGDVREDNLTVHTILLNGGILILEEINLKGVEPGQYEFIALPLNIKEGDAGPCRAIIRPI